MFISSFKSFLPPIVLRQEETLRWLAKVYALHSGRSVDEYGLLLDRVACPPTAIRERRFFFKEYGKDLEESLTFGPQAPRGGPDSLKRSHIYQSIAEEVFAFWYDEEKSSPDELIHVSCTGYVSPSAAQLTVSRREWRTAVTHAYHMGCAAAIPALRMAGSSLAHRELLNFSRVDIAHTELCSLHLNPVEPTAEQMVVESLFADGCIRYSLTAERPPQGFEVLGVAEILLPGTEEAMAWISGPFGMRMVLSREVPRLIGANIEAAFQGVCDRWRVSAEKLRREALFAIHPGGPKILDQAMNWLGIQEHQIRHSRQVLLDRGNLSSASLPHVWAAIVEDSSISENTPVVSFAFAPGLTVAAALLKVIR